MIISAGTGIGFTQAAPGYMTLPYAAADPNAVVLGDSMLVAPDQIAGFTSHSFSQNTNSAQLAPANLRTIGPPASMGRRGLYISNTSINGILYIVYGAGPASLFTPWWMIQIPIMTMWAMRDFVWNGAVQGVWDVAGAGKALVWDFT